MACTPQALTKAMNAFAGGSYRRFGHPLNRKCVYSEGVRAVADKAGAYWLIDVMALAMAPVFAHAWEAGKAGMGFVELEVSGSTGVCRLLLEDDAPSAVSQDIAFTDFPPGRWRFYLGMAKVAPDEYVTTIYLPVEH